MHTWNRATFDDYLQNLQEREGRSNACYAIVLADIDNFKKSNDCYGHSAGDEALRSVAQAMRKALRRQDFIARYGGEEIAVICETADEDVALSNASRRTAVGPAGASSSHRATRNSNAGDAPARFSTVR